MGLDLEFERLNKHCNAQAAWREFNPIDLRNGDISSATQTLVKRLLVNSWSAEYALTLRPIVNGEALDKSALDWTFPQAYYAILFSARAMLAAQGTDTPNESVLKKRIHSRIAARYYPPGLDFYVSGLSSYGYHNLSPDSDLRPYLKRLRQSEIVGHFERLQTSPRDKITNDEGNLLTSLDQLTTEQRKRFNRLLGYTTFFEYIELLKLGGVVPNTSFKIKDDPTIDVLRFHTELRQFVSNVSGVHEFYVAQLLGEIAYIDLLRSLPSYLSAFPSIRFSDNTFIRL